MRTTLMVKRSGAILATAVLWLMAAMPTLAAITPEPNTPAGATTIASKIVATPGILVGAQFTAFPPSGTPNGWEDAPLTEFPTNGSTFGILTSGDVNNVDDPGTFTSVNDGGPAVHGDSAFDVSILKVDVTAPAGSNCLTFDFKFLSEEYPYYVGNIYNDAFIAELDLNTWTAVGSNITAPNNFAFDGNGDVVSVNSTGIGGMTAAQGAGTAYDGGGSTSTPPPAGGSAGGATVLLQASTQITPGAHSVYFSIFDQGDQILDSAVFLDNLRIGFVPDPSVNCAPGAQPVNFQMTLTPADDTNPIGTAHTVTATLTDEDGAAVSGATIQFNVTGAHTTSGTGVTAANGEATFTYTGANLGDDVITACYDQDADGTCEVTAAAAKHWTVGAPANLTLTPETSTNTAGDEHCVTATVTDVGGNPLSGVTVDFTVTGANPTTGAGVTDASGEAEFCYVGTVAGDDTITATAVGGSNPSDTATKTWEPGDPATLVLTPDAATNTVDAEHCVTATVEDAFGNPTPGITVRFSVNPTTFRTPSSGSAVTDSAGQAEFCYTSALPGNDVISAYADTNDSGVQDVGEPGDTATKTWILPASTAGCKITYGGRITAANGDKATFGGNAKGTGPSGQEEYQDHGPAVAINVHSINVQAVTCSTNRTMGSIFGTATINGAGSYDYRIDMKDLGEPGTTDTYRIRLSNGYDSGEAVIVGGNVQIR